MIVAIDLGTTNSLIAVWEDEGARLIPNALGENLTPSCVSLDEDGTILVGKAARERLQTRPDRTAAVFKRHMGTDRLTRLGNREFRPEELSSFVLRALKEDAESALGQPVTEAIITVPAYFSEAQRRATRAAATLAGLHVERLLNEPTAAALAYGIHLRDEESKFLVLDLGGGTFDVSILDLFAGVMEVRATSGDNFLGGEDFNRAMLDHFFQEGHIPARYRKGAVAMGQIEAHVERLRKAMSQSGSAKVPVHLEGADFELSMDEPTLELICAPLLKRFRDPVERALRDARMRPDELDAVILAGGATRMPLVRNLVARMLGRAPSSEINPDEVIVMGAAVQAGLKARNVSLSEMVMTDVAPYSLGLEIARTFDETHVYGQFDPIIERNSVIPVSRVKNYTPLQEGQKVLELKVYQGESRLVKDNILIGTLRVDLPKAPREECNVDVRFTYDVNGLLEVEATPTKTRETRRVIIKGNAGMLSDEEIEIRLKALAQLKIHPREKLENRTALAWGDRVYQLLTGPYREAFGVEMALFDKALESQDDHTIVPARKRLIEVIEQVETELMRNSGPLQ